MATTVMSVKIDKQLKEKAQKIAKDMGFPLGTLINAYLRQFVKNKTVYFSISPSEKMTEAMNNELEKIERDIQEDIELSPSFEKMEDGLNYLKNK